MTLLGKFDQNRFTRFFWIVGAAMVLMFYAWLNGYPIVYSDTSTFLASGFGWQTPFDRPITYGLFLWLTSINGLSLWTVVFVQSLLLSYLIFKVLGVIKIAPQLQQVVSFLVVVVLTVFTGVSWVTSQLIADVFTPIMVLSMACLLMCDMGLKERVFLYFIFTLATAMHMSHISANIVTLVLILLLSRVKLIGLIGVIDYRAILIMMTLSLATILTMGSALAKSKHAFFMGALIEHGIIQEYLEEYCPEKNYALCEYREDLPTRAWIFLWDEESPFYKMGDWKGTKGEFNEIIMETLTSPKYVWLHIKASVSATIDQLAMFKMGDGNGDFMEGTLLYERIQKYVPGEVDQYSESRQNTQGFSYLKLMNKVQVWSILISVLMLVLIMREWSRLGHEWRTLFLVLLVALVINAWSGATFANAINRFGVKMIWLLPLLALVYIVTLGKTQYDKRTRNSL